MCKPLTRLGVASHARKVFAAFAATADREDYFEHRMGLFQLSASPQTTSRAVHLDLCVCIWVTKLFDGVSTIPLWVECVNRSVSASNLANVGMHKGGRPFLSASKVNR